MRALEEIIKRAWDEAVEMAEQYLQEYVEDRDYNKFKDNFQGIADLVDTKEIVRHNRLVEDKLLDDYEIECVGDYDDDDPRIYIGIYGSEDTLIFSDWMERASNRISLS